MDSNESEQQALIQAILANISREICQPLDLLQDGIGKLLEDPTRPINEAERGQAVTMLEICNDLGRLTRECLGTSESRD